MMGVVREVTLVLSLFIFSSEGWTLTKSKGASSAQRSSESSLLYSSRRGKEDNFGKIPEDSDWVTAELTLINGPQQPNPELDPETVAVTCSRALQWVDYPTKSAGLERCFQFFTWECRKVVTARRGGDTVERFCQHGLLSPALQPFMGAYRIDIGNVTLTPAQPPLRGALASFPIVIQGAPIFSAQHMSGMERNGVGIPPETHMVMRLEQQRRPPMQGCWLVREVLDVRHAFAGDLGNSGVGG